MQEEAETLEIVTDPPGNLAQDKMQQRAIQHLLNTAHFIMGTMAHDLKIDISHASSIMLSCLTTTVMVFIRAYPREHWAAMFREVSEYFARMAGEADVANTKGNGHDADPDS